MADIRIDENVMVAKTSGRELRVDLFHPPEGRGAATGVLFFPGGGFRTANRGGLRERYGLRLAEKGFVFVAAEYRVMDEAPWPAQILDSKTMIRWVRANSAGLGIDPARIVSGGASAGGLLALLAAGTQDVLEFEGTEGTNPSVSSEVAAVIGLYPVTDMTEWGRRPGQEKLFGQNPSTSLLEAATPIHYVNPGYPPTMLIHGMADQLVSHSKTMRMYQALERAGVPVDLHLYAGQDHIFDRDPELGAAVTDAIALFISRYVPSQDPLAAG